MNPITREESLLDGQDLTPITRKEQFIKRIYDKTQEVPEPITREEWFLKKAGEGTSPVTIEQLNATENGTYSETGKAYSPVIVEVPAPTLKTKTITENGTYTASEDNADGYSQVTVAVEGFKKKSIANTPTDIASFNDGTANPMPSLEISIEPVQSGSGDPSPSNVRPISGWSGANVTKCGKNLFDKNNFVNDYPTKYTIAQDGSIETANTITADNVLWVNQLNYNGQISVTFVYKYANAGSVGLRIRAKYKDGTATTLYTLPMQEYTTLTWKSEKTIDYLYTDYGTLTNKTNFYLQVELGSAATTYSPYQGSTLSIPFHDSSDNPIIVYGGRLNVTSGELTLTLASVDMGTLYWTYDSERDVFASLPSPTAKNLFTGICSVYPFVGSYSNLVDKSCAYIYNNYIAVRDHDYADATAFKAAMNGAQFVYELATPQTYQLTPTQVATLLGQNNIFADCGQILQGEYFVTL